MTSTLYVDPPEGWRFGFPKAVPKDREADLLSWMIEQGYPKEMFDKYSMMRCWREEGESDDR
jgi:hypothetical protein